MRERESERECGSSGALEKCFKYRKLHIVESRGGWQADGQQQAVSPAYEELGNQHKDLCFSFTDYSVDGVTGGLLSARVSVVTGRGDDTAGQVAIAVWASQSESILVLLSDVTLHQRPSW